MALSDYVGLGDGGRLQNIGESLQNIGNTIVNIANFVISVLQTGRYVLTTFLTSMGDLIKQVFSSGLFG